MSPALTDQEHLQDNHRTRKQPGGSTTNITMQLVILIATSVIKNWSIFNCLHPSSQGCDLLDFPLFSFFFLVMLYQYGQNFTQISGALSLHIKSWAILKIKLSIQSHKSLDEDTSDFRYHQKGNGIKKTKNNKPAKTAQKLKPQQTKQTKTHNKTEVKKTKKPNKSHQNQTKLNKTKQKENHTRENLGKKQVSIL